MTILSRLLLLVDVIVLVTMATAAAAEMTKESDGHSLVTSAPDSSVNRDVIAAARCRVRCLSLLKSSNEDDDMTLLSNVMETTSLMNCLQDDECSTCMKPCNHPLLNLHSCDDICKTPKEEEEIVCSKSCSFLKEVVGRNRGPGPGPPAGLCPPLVPSPVEGSSRGGNPCSSVTGKKCSNDSAVVCDRGQKCCTTRCGLLCVEPVSTSSDDYPQVPQVPQAPTLKDKTKSGSSVELKWNSVAENGTGPVLYIVDSRWNIGKSHDEREMTSWQQVTQTTSASALLSDINPGRWYQFRVVAVSMGGSRGASAPTPAFTPSKEPRRPGPPTNLTEGDTLIAGGKMSVTIRWFPPKRSDLPVTRYKLFWSKRLKATAAESAENREFHRLLPSDRLTYQLQDLESDTTYIVQVQTICHFGDERLKSDKSTIYITTYSLPNPSDHYGGGGGGGGGGLSGESGGGGALGRQLLPTPPPVKGMFVDKPFYENGSLKTNVTWSYVGNEGVRGGGGGGGLRFLVRWSPEACIADGSSSAVDDRSLSRVISATTSESHFLIYDLRTDCRYLVKVEPVSGHGASGKVAVASFSTPPCSQLECLDNAGRIPEAPPHLTHSFLISSSNITSRLSWEVPASENPIVGYRVVWGPVVRPSLHHHHHHHHHPSPTTRDKTLTNVKIVPKDVRSVNLGNLLEGTTYLVEVQGITKLASGRMASIQIATPLLQQTHIDKKQQDSSKKRTNFVSNSTAIMMMMKTTTTTRRTFQRPQTHSSASSSSSSSSSFSAQSSLTIGLTYLLFFNTHRLYFNLFNF